jgi:hypothetical protein
MIGGQMSMLSGVEFLWSVRLSNQDDEIVIRIYAWWTALAQCDQIVISRMYVFDKWRSVRSVSISWKLKLERETCRKRGGCQFQVMREIQSTKA